MRHGGRKFLLVAALAAALLVLGSAMGEEPAGPVGEAGPFAGPAACGDCHPDLFEAWSRSTHAKTLERATPSNLPRVMAEGGRIFHPPGESRFRVEDGRVFVETVGPDGEMREYPVDWILGARRVRMYMTTLENGRRQVLPFMLDEPNERFFDYSDLVFGAGGDDRNTAPVIRPGEPSFWTGYPRFFDARCARCHTVGWEFRGFDAGPGESPSTWVHDGVTCEACHGPAGDHAAWWNDELGGADDPIRAVGDLSEEGWNGICLSCHTEAEPAEPLFRPGDDAFEAFDPSLLDDTERLDPAGRPLELVYDGVPFAASRCAEEGGLTCLSCHDPHGSPYRGQLTAPPGDPSLCASCHEGIAAEPQAHSRHDPSRSGGRCTDCHMPSLTVERGHGVVTDHTIGVPNPGFAGEGIALDACTWCHTGERGAPGGVPRLERERIRAAYDDWWPDAVVRPGFAPILHRARRDDAEVLPELVALAEAGDAPAVARASATALLGRFPVAAAEKALVRLARDDSSLVRRRAADALAGFRSGSADSVLLSLLFDDSAAVRNHAARAALRGWSRVRNNRALLEPVLIVLRERVEAFPEDDSAWFLFGAASQIRGDVPTAIRAYEKKLELDPYASHVRKALESLRRR